MWLRRNILEKIIVCFLCLMTLGCSRATISREREMHAGPVAAPKMIYVTDFELEAADIQSDKGLLKSQPQRSGPLRDTAKRLRGQKDPQVRSRELVDLMSASLVKELAKRRLNASRLGPTDPLPAEGLLVRGIFTDVEEGNRLRRAVIGFGSGQTQLQIVLSVDDLSQGSPKQLYELDTTAKSGRMPGAVITLNPYVAAAKFVLSSRDLEKNVTKTASKIADYIADRLSKQAGPSD